MEVLMENLAEQELILLDNVQIKSEQKISVPTGVKKIMSVTSSVMEQKIENNHDEFFLKGNIVTRLVFLNEFEKYDSEDITESFERKITVKEHNAMSQAFARVWLTKSAWKVIDDKVNVDNIMTANVYAVKALEMQIVGNLTGDVEVQKTEQQMLTFNSRLCENFEISENVQLDNACEGVLGVDVNPNLKDVVASAGKVNVKGVMVANILCVKAVDGVTVPYSMVHEIDFAKSIVVNNMTDEDLACGQIKVDKVSMHIENNQQGAMLALSCEVTFDGSAYSNRKFSMVSDAISFNKELSLQTKQLNYLEILPQVNTVVDIENNLNLAPNTPYISHVLAVDGMRVDDLQVSVADNKALLEGVLVVNLLLENEERVVNGERFEVPFQTYVRMDNLDREYVVNAHVVPLTVNVKARRGTELLIDAQLGVNVQAETKKTLTVVNSLIEGQDKSDDGSAIRIYIIGEKENLWSLAKRTNLSREALLQQNPNLENGCIPGERIVVYRHENVSL